MNLNKCALHDGEHRFVPVGKNHEWCSYCGTLRGNGFALPYMTPTTYRNIMEVNGDH